MVFHSNKKIKPMIINKKLEDIFKERVESGEFKFSYSSLNRLIYSPQLFYKDYILKDKELRTDKHLVKGKLIHLMLLQPENFDKEFILVPARVPSDALRKVLKNISLYTDIIKLNDIEDKIILDCLKEANLYQSLKEDEKRLAKVQTLDNEEYFKFMSTSDKDIVDQITFDDCFESVELLKDNKSVMKLLETSTTDFEMDSIEVHNESMLECELNDYKFGLKGIVDRYVIDHDKKDITVIDLKTTGKTISDFPETVEFYNYWMQAAIYINLIIKNVEENTKDYKINFNFVVIDKYNQIYSFPVSKESITKWGLGLKGILDMANHHYEKNRYDLPYEFLDKVVSL